MLLLFRVGSSPFFARISSNVLCERSVYRIRSTCIKLMKKMRSKFENELVVGNRDNCGRTVDICLAERAEPPRRPCPHRRACHAFLLFQVITVEILRVQAATWMHEKHIDEIRAFVMK